MDWHHLDRGGLPSGYVIASAEDMAHFLIPHLNGGRFGDTQLVSAQSIAELLQPVAPEGSTDEYYAMDWSVSNIDGEEWIFKGGDICLRHRWFWYQARNGVVTLINKQ
jgi:CubicO group peptidase (beta-lactamase class C family)